jgi:hypothetical protein
MSRFTWLHILIAVLCALAIVLFLRVRNASGVTLLSDSVSAGYLPGAAWHPNGSTIARIRPQHLKRD